MGPEEQVDLVIIGAGPTGLTTALLARKLGLSVLIVDKAPGLLQVGRADALNARSQETLELIGVLENLEAAGLRCNTSSTFQNGEFTSRQSHWWTSLQHVHRPNFLLIGQADVEHELASKLDIPIHHNVTVNRLEEMEENGSIVVRTYFNNRVVASKYALGADGARSFVRSHLGIPFEGTKPGMVWAVLDTFLDTDFPVCSEIISFQHEGQARISWIPRERGMARFYVLLKGEITQALAEAEIKKFLQPYRIDFVRTEWFSKFEIKERVARTYFSEKKHIVLAGDAAHVHAVNGGQGLNTGIADAFALAWRINMAVRGYPWILDSYETERLESAQKVIDVAAKLVRSTIKTAQEYVSLIEKNASYITGCGVTYPLSIPMIQGSRAGIFVPGNRCPDVYLHRGRLAERLYTICTYGQFITLSNAQLQKVNNPYVTNWVVAGRDSQEAGIHFDRVTDAQNEAINIDMAIVIRPDMYIGYVGKDAEAYLETVFQIRNDG